MTVSEISLAALPGNRVWMKLTSAAKLMISISTTCSWASRKLSASEPTLMHLSEGYSASAAGLSDCSATTESRGYTMFRRTTLARNCRPGWSSLQRQERSVTGRSGAGSSVTRFAEAAMCICTCQDGAIKLSLHGPGASGQSDHCQAQGLHHGAAESAPTQI